MQTPGWLKKKKWLVFVPAVLLVFILFGCWLFMPSTRLSTTERANVLNPSLPNAVPDDRDGWTKMDYYRQADKDSAARLSMQKKDPYYDWPLQQEDSAYGQQHFSAASLRERQMNRQLDALEQQLKTPEKKISGAGHRMPSPISRSTAYDDQQLRRLAQAIYAPPAKANETDPQLQQVEQVLDKLLQVQQPAEKKQARDLAEEHVYPARVSRKHCETFLFTSAADTMDQTIEDAHAWFSIADQHAGFNDGDIIHASVSAGQRVITGSMVQLSLQDELIINGRVIPPRTLLEGKVSLNAGRVFIHIASVFTGDALMPVSLDVYSLDGLQGLPAPPNALQLLGRQAQQRSLQHTAWSTPASGFAAATAQAGIASARDLLVKKTKQAAIQLRTNEPVLLIATHNNTTN